MLYWSLVKTMSINFIFRWSITFLTGCDFAFRIFKMFLDQFFGDQMINSSVWFAVSINVAFLAFVVVFYSSSSRTGKFDYPRSFLSNKTTFINILINYLESAFLYLVDKISKVVSMIFFLIVSSNKSYVLTLIFISYRCVNEDILENALLRELNNGYGTERVLIWLHNNSNSNNH